MKAKDIQAPPKVATQISVKIPTELKRKLSEVAKTERRPLTWVLIKAVENYIEAADSTKIA